MKANLLLSSVFAASVASIPAQGLAQRPTDWVALDGETPPAVPRETLRFGQNVEATVSVPPSRRQSAPIVIKVSAHGEIRDTYEVSTGWLDWALYEARFSLATVAFEPGHAPYGRTYLEGLARGIAELVARASKHGFDGSRVVLVGQGWGGHIAALLATDVRYFQAAGLDFRSLKGAVIIEGQGLDLPAVLATANSKRKRQIAQFLKDDALDAAGLSPLHHAAAPNARHFLLMPLRRDKQALAATEALAVSLRSAGANVEVRPLARSHSDASSTDIGHRDHRETKALLGFIRSATE